MRRRLTASAVPCGSAWLTNRAPNGFTTPLLPAINHRLGKVCRREVRAGALLGGAMGLTDLPILSMLRTRLDWAQQRQRLLAENVANADTPNYRPRDLVPPKFDAPGEATLASIPGVTLARTEQGHLAGIATGDTGFRSTSASDYEVQATGNGVNLEQEMMKVAANTMDYQAVTALYTRSLGLLKTALGKADRVREQAMEFFRTLAIAAAGLRAQSGRMRIISENIANADSTPSTPGADPYRRKIPTFQTRVRPLARRQSGRARQVGDRQFRLPAQIRARPSRRRRQRQCQISQRQCAGGNERHARGAAHLRSQYQRDHRHAAHAPAHHRYSQGLTRTIATGGNRFSPELVRQ